MEVTGERYLPSMGLAMSLEHWHRYLLVAPLAEGRDVLDIASGQGYGSHFLASRAKSVVGVDISVEAIAEARANYVAPNLRFLEGSVAAIPLPDACVDLVVSFETIEHVGDELQTAFYDEVRRVLRPDGRLVISTPDKAVYSTARNYQNPYHVREYERDEFLSLLRERFAQVQVCEQRAALFSLVSAQPLADSFALRGSEERFEPTSKKLTYEYLIAVCSPAALAPVSLGNSVAFDESILTEQYDTATRALVAASAVAEERADHIRDLLSTLEQERSAQSKQTLEWMAIAEERRLEIERASEEIRSWQAVAEERAKLLQESSQALIAAQAVAEERAEELRRRDEQMAAHRQVPPITRTPISAQPLVSVVIPSYNHRAFVCQAIDSALGQTHKNVEVIVIDDGSTDGSPELLKSRYGSDPRVRLSARENRGAHTTINEALKSARGELINILNSDDVYEPRRFELMIESARQHGGHPFFGISGLRVVDERGEPSLNSGPLTYYTKVVEKFEGRPDAAAFWVGNLAMTTSNFFFSRAVLDAVGEFAPLRYTHDWDWALRASERFGLVRVNDVLLHYRVHGSNTISESNLWKHVAENAYVFGSALQRRGTAALAHLAGVTPLDVCRAMLANESFGPVPTLFVLSLGLENTELQELLVSGELEKLMPQLLGAPDSDLMLSVDHLRRKLKAVAPKPRASAVRRAVAAVKKTTKRVRKRLAI